jgi:hypothetical protein
VNVLEAAQQAFGAVCVIFASGATPPAVGVVEEDD